MRVVSASTPYTENSLSQGKSGAPVLLLLHKHVQLNYTAPADKNKFFFTEKPADECKKLRNLRRIIL